MQPRINLFCCFIYVKLTFVELEGQTLFNLNISQFTFQTKT